MKRPNILLVDDDEVYVYVTKRILSNLSDNLQLTSFADGEPAIEHLNTCINKNLELPGVILLDINMPFMDGWIFLKEFNKIKPELNKEIPIYMVTSSEDQRDVKKAEEFETLTGYVIKPVFEDKLVEILTEVYGDNW